MSDRKHTHTHWFTYPDQSRDHLSPLHHLITLVSMTTTSSSTIQVSLSLSPHPVSAQYSSHTYVTVCPLLWNLPIVGYRGSQERALNCNLKPLCCSSKFTVLPLWTVSTREPKPVIAFAYQILQFHGLLHKQKHPWAERMNIHDKHTNNQINSPLIQMLTFSYLTSAKSQICFNTKTLYLFFSFSLIHFSMFLIRKTLKVFENERKKT